MLHLLICIWISSFVWPSWILFYTTWRQKWLAKIMSFILGCIIIVYWYCSIPFRHRRQCRRCFRGATEKSSRANLCVTSVIEPFTFCVWSESMRALSSEFHFKDPNQSNLSLRISSFSEFRIYKMLIAKSYLVARSWS